VTECFDNFIDGESAPGASTRPNINPSDTTDVVGDFACASMSDCEPPSTPPPMPYSHEALDGHH